MARIAFILLCHKDPEGIIAQAKRLAATGDYVSIHFDGRANPEHYQKLRSALDDNPSVVFADKRLKCGWGEWSLVAASLEAVRKAVDSFPLASHFYMLSGDCMPVKSAAYAHEFLDAEDCDYIESFDFFESDWIKTGFREERLIYWHFFNERTQKRRFYFSYNLQKRLNITRDVPKDIEVQIGSQWWCLRRQTVEKIIEFCDKRRDVMRFFATTWIPDETFFQTLVPHLIPRKEIRSRTLTFLIFSDYGMPVTFHNDHYETLIGQDYLFARKVSAEATELRARLGSLWQEEESYFPISGGGRELYHFLAGQGRFGRRFAPRFWEADSSIGRDRTPLLIVSKKWHFAKRLTAAIRKQTDIPAVDYLFNEEEANLPDMGGVETTLAKRHRHRRALVKLLFDQLDAERLVLCLDPSELTLIRDFIEDRANTRILFIDSAFDDEYVHGHLRRVGLVAENTPQVVYDRLTPMVRKDLEHEAERVQELTPRNFERIAADRNVEQNTAAISNFLRVPPELARELAETPHLFAD